MTGPSTFAEKRCHGYGVAAHLTDGGLIHALQPVAMLLCGPCWRRWSRVHDQPGRRHR